MPRPLPRYLRRVGGAAALWLHAATVTRAGAVASVTSADGGVGRSTLVAALGGVLAAAIPAPVLAVDATLRLWGGLAQRVSEPGPGTVWDAVTQVGMLTSAAEVARIARRGPGGLHVLVGETGRDVDRRPPTFDELTPLVSRVRAFHPLTMLELPPAEAPWTLLALSGSLVPLFVARAQPQSVWHTLRLLAALREIGLGHIADRAVVVVVETAPRPAREVLAAERQARTQVRELVRLPYDPALATDAPVPLHRLRRATLTALVTLAIHVAHACAPPAPGPWAQPTVPRPGW